jgi:lipopolysaccharide transport system ATP-binding protein
VQNAIEVKKLSKQFRRFHPHRPYTLKEAFISGFRSLRSVEQFWALKDVSFSVAKGTILGIIGANGSGKSTLLRVLGGVYKAEEGKININGRIGTLIELGGGLENDLTGRENIFINGIIAGLNRREVGGLYDSIVEFSELEDFIDNPVRTYSSGMKMRLSFSVAIHINPEILLIDEILSVGDISFQSKCFDRIMRIKDDGCAIVFVSHDMNKIRQICEETIWLNYGQIQSRGNPDFVIADFQAKIAHETRLRMPNKGSLISGKQGKELKLEENRFGSLEVEITEINFSNLNGAQENKIKGGDSLEIEINYLTHKSVKPPIFGVNIIDENRTDCCSFYINSKNIIHFLATGIGQINLRIDRLDLNSGKYFINVGIYEENWAYAYDFHWNVYPLFVSSPNKNKGIISPPYKWEFKYYNKSKHQESNS